MLPKMMKVNSILTVLNLIMSLLDKVNRFGRQACQEIKIKHLKTIAVTWKLTCSLTSLSKVLPNPHFMALITIPNITMLLVARVRKPIFLHLIVSRHYKNSLQQVKYFFKKYRYV
jgi:hypothetical protein